MLLNQLSPSRRLKIVRFTEEKIWHTAQRFVVAESIPLRLETFAASRARLILPQATVALVGSFPRILDGIYGHADPIVVIPASAPSGATVNGIPVEDRTVGIICGQASYSLFEKLPNWFFTMRIDASARRRGWPEVVNAVALFKAPPRAAEALRSTLEKLFVAASGHKGNILTDEDMEAMQASLLRALDRVFEGGKAKLVDQRPSLLHLRLIRQIDDRLASNPSAAIYSGDLASELNVSIRSLHVAAMSIRGMSLHRYLKIRRLWLVRRGLLAAEPGARVKSLALAHGFWHLGQFSLDYRKLFGEMPSATLARGGDRGRDSER